MPSHEELTAAFDAALTGGEPDAFVAALAPGAVVWHNHDHNEVDARENMAGIAMLSQLVDDLENEHVLFAPTDDGFVLAYVDPGQGPLERQALRDAQLPDRHHHRRRPDQPHRRVRRPDRGSAVRMTMDVEATIDPEIAAALAVSPMGAIDFGTFTFEAMPAMREAMANMPAVELPPTTTESHEVVVPGATGFDPTVRVYAPPTKAADRPCIYWIHGGGYMFGSGLNVDARINRWVEEFDCVAVSIEYRLAPEDPYPAPLDDCYAGLVWIAQHADELGIDPNRIVVAGASAGAGLAAGLAILARDRGEVSLAYQLLIYPMIDDSNTTRVEPDRGRAGVEPRRQRPGVAGLPR